MQLSALVSEPFTDAAKAEPFGRSRHLRTFQPDARLSPRSRVTLRLLSSHALAPGRLILWRSYPVAGALGLPARRLRDPGAISSGKGSRPIQEARAKADQDVLIARLVVERSGEVRQRPVAMLLNLHEIYHNSHPRALQSAAAVTVQQCR